MWTSERFHWMWLALTALPYRPRHVASVMDDFGTLVPVDTAKALAFIA